MMAEADDISRRRLSGACDCHLHVYEPAAPSRMPAPEFATADAYIEARNRLGLSRAVIIQPKHYGTDNTVLLRGIARLGVETTRGIAVIHPDVDEDELKRLHSGGVRGVRFSLHTPENAVVDLGMLEAVAERVHPYGWHLQLHWAADQIAAHQNILRDVPTPLVFDHMARLPVHRHDEHPAFSFIGELIEQRRAWVKLSAPYLNSRLGAAHDYADADRIARSWLEITRDQLVWGSDWPHVTELPAQLDDASLLQSLTRWTEDIGLSRRILVDNPAALYGFNRQDSRGT